MQVAIALFPRNTSLDAIGPYEVLLCATTPSMRSPSPMWRSFPAGCAKSTTTRSTPPRTTHWRAQDLFNALGATYVPQRVVEHLVIEYDPEPPFDSGDLAKACAATHRLALEFYPAVSQLTTSSDTLVRLPTQATLLPRTDRGRT